MTGGGVEGLMYGGSIAGLIMVGSYKVFGVGLTWERSPYMGRRM